MAETLGGVSILAEAAGETEIKEFLSRGFGQVRVIRGADGKHLVFAHDRASGVVREDTWVYRKRADVWVLLGMRHASSRACSGVVAKDRTVSLLDQKGTEIARFELED